MLKLPTGSLSISQFTSYLFSVSQKFRLFVGGVIIRQFYSQMQFHINQAAKTSRVRRKIPHTVCGNTLIMVMENGSTCK